MAMILPLPTNSKKAKLHAARIDMTPMVDLGFLLITFFIFTTTLSEPTITKLSMPQSEGIQHVYEKTLLTVILDKSKVMVYEGKFNSALQNNALAITDYNQKSGLGHFVRQKQASLQDDNLQDKLMVAIKPLLSTSYQEVLNALDEMKINGVLRYGIMELNPEEKAYLLNK